MKIKAIALALALPFVQLAAGCGMFYTTHPSADGKMAVAEEEEHWTCPHEGGDFKHAGKCPNSWCGMDLVRKTK